MAALGVSLGSVSHSRVVLELCSGGAGFWLAAWKADGWTACLRAGPGRLGRLGFCDSSPSDLEGLAGLWVPPLLRGVSCGLVICSGCPSCSFKPSSAHARQLFFSQAEGKSISRPLTEMSHFKLPTHDPYKATTYLPEDCWCRMLRGQKLSSRTSKC